MTQEEKAKAYDEAIEKAKKRYNEEYTSTLERSTLAYVFPALKESEDERIKGNIIATIHLYYGEPLEDEAKEMIAWLERQGEQKLTWSEEDEDNLSSAIYYIRREPYRECDVEPIVDWLRNKLSSLKPQSTWKPSDEQIKGIECAIKTLKYQLNAGDKRLNSLYNDLKKLREE